MWLLLKLLKPLRPKIPVAGIFGSGRSLVERRQHRHLAAERHG
jgi:hypothetical protein